MGISKVLLKLFDHCMSRNTVQTAPLYQTKTNYCAKLYSVLNGIQKRIVQTASGLR